MNPAIFDRPSGAGALLGPGDIATPTAGYSLRYLSINYFGQPVIRVRKDVVGNPEQDFTPNQLTDGTLATFLGANDGFVSKWYDQFGSNDAEQTSASSQPKIWDASTGLVTENGKPALDFDGNDDVLKIPDFAYNVAGGKLTIFATSLCEASTGSNQYLFAHYDSGTNNRSWAVIYNDSNRFLGSYSRNGSSSDLQTMEFNGFSFNTQYLTYYIFDTSLSADNRIKGSYNGVDFTLNNRGGSESSIYNSAGDLSIGSALTNGSPVVEFRGLVQEIIFYDSDQSANRTKIEDNINVYYVLYGLKHYRQRVLADSGTFALEGRDALVYNSVTIPEMPSLICSCDAYKATKLYNINPA